MKDYKNEIINHYEKTFNQKVSLIKKMPESKGLLGFDILIFRATTKRPYHILATVGLFEHKMRGKMKKMELLTYLDKKWNLFSNDEEFAWVYTVIQRVISGFYYSERGVEYGQTYLTEGSNTFSKYTEMNATIFYCPVGLNESDWQIKLGFNKKVDLILMTTATYKEYALVRKMGGLSFVKYLLDEGGINNLAIVNRRKKN